MFGNEKNRSDDISPPAKPKAKQRRKGKAMSPGQLQAIVGKAVDQARNSTEHSRLVTERNDLHARFMAEPYGDEVDDRSQIVTSEIADTTEWMLAALLRIFASTDQVVKFEPVGAEDEPLAEQETDYTNHVFWQGNRGFLLLYSFFKDALLYKNGICKVRWEEREETRVERYYDMDGDALMKLLDEIDSGEAEVEVLEHEERDDPEQIEAWQQAMAEFQAMQISNPGGNYAGSMQPQLPAPTGAPAAGSSNGRTAAFEAVNAGSMPAPAPMEPPERPTLHTIAFRITETLGRPVAEPVPPDEFGIAPGHNSVFLEDAPLVYHRRKRTISDLIASGYERRQVQDLPSESEADALPDTDPEGESWEEVDLSMREVWVTEAYIRVDYDGDGLAELRKVTIAGDDGEILRWEDTGEEDLDEVEEIPFAALTPNIMTHRFWGRSVAELIADLQKINTVLHRTLLDNVVSANHPSYELPAQAEGQYTIDDLLNQRVGNRIVRTDAPGLLREIQHVDVTSSLYPAIELINATKENRTGVTRYNQGLDADSLNKTATGLSRILDQAQEKMLLIARIFAETGVKDLFQKLHDLLRRHSSKAQTVRLRNEWIEIDPRHWRSRSDVTVTVGLGTGDRDKLLGQLQLIIMEQKEHMLAGSPLVTPQELFNSYTKVIEAAGLRDVSPYFRDPSKVQQDQAKEGMDPVQAQLQAAQQQIQVEAQTEVMKAQAKGEVDMQIAQLKAQTDIQVAQIKAQADLQIALIKEQAQAQLKRESMQVEGQIRREGMMMDGELKREGLERDGELKREGMEMQDRFRRSRPTGGDGNVNGRM